MYILFLIKYTPKILIKTAKFERDVKNKLSKLYLSTKWTTSYIHLSFIIVEPSNSFNSQFVTYQLFINAMPNLLLYTASKRSILMKINWSALNIFIKVHNGSNYFGECQMWYFYVICLVQTSFPKRAFMLTQKMTIVHWLFLQNIIYTNDL